MGDNIILCPQACISHHCRLGAHGFYAPGALLSGAVEVGERCFIGANATVRDRVRIGEGCVIGAGALVMEDCAPGGVYRGNYTRRTRDLKG
jgi:acetyltransferase-like isoleucine patch superfamily enzyme